MRVDCDNDARFATLGDGVRDIFRQKSITDTLYIEYNILNSKP